MAPTESSRAKLATLIWSTCLTNFLYQGPTVEGARYYHGNDDSRRAGRRLPPGHPMGTSRFGRRDAGGRPPAHHDTYEDYPADDDRREEEEEGSFYERNGLTPPPLVSRADRLRRRRRTTELTEEVSAAEMMPRADETLGEEDFSTLIRRDLLFSGGYDRHAYPWDYAWDGQAEGERTGVPVEFSINFHRVFSVDVVNPVLDMIVWMRTEWTDPRLTWQPEEYGNLTKIWCWIGEGGAGGETSEIWTPDIELWNLEDGLRRSFVDAYAIVSNDGSVWWSRPGHLRPVCKFVGLITFPFDTLTCAMEFGSWSYSGKYMRLVKGGGSGFSIGGSETAGASYNEFSFKEEDPVQCEVHVYPPYPAAPEEDWPVLMYHVTIDRSWQPYARGYLLTQLLLNIIGFSAFWLPPSCGERMGLSITAMLAAVAAEIAVASNLPVAAEYTWFSKVNLLSICFACISLLESVAVLYFYYKRSESLTPGWFTELKEWDRIRRARKQGGDAMRIVQKSCRDLAGSLSNHSRDGNHPCDDQDEDSFLKEDNINEVVALDDLSPSNTLEEEKKDTFEAHPQNPYQKRTKGASQTHGLDKKEPVEKFVDDDEISIDNSDIGDSCPSEDYGHINTRSTNRISDLSFNGHISGARFDFPKAPDQSNAGDRAPLEKDLSRVYFNKDEGRFTFTPTDTFNENEHSTVTPEEEKAPTTMKNEGMPEEVRKSVRFGEPDQDTTPNLSRRKAHPSALRVGLSTTKLESNRAKMMKDSQQGSLASFIARDADDFNNEEEVEANRRWKRIAARIDDIARFWIPFAYSVGIGIVVGEIWPTKDE